MQSGRISHRCRRESAPVPLLKTGAEVLLGLLVLLLIAYRFRTHQVRRERKIRYRIARMIAHLCDTYDSLEDVDWKNRRCTGTIL